MRDGTSTGEHEAKTVMRIRLQPRYTYKEHAMIKNTIRFAAISFAIACALSIPASAQSQMGGANQEYMKSMERMDADMKKGMDPDPTKAWAKMMVAHHQGAIDMSQTVLKETKDPTIREMAQKGIDEQTKEQKMLKEWIAKHGG